MHEPSLESVRLLDAADPLRALRSEFDLPLGTIYLDGNSLGALPRATGKRMAQVIDEWGRDLIKSWIVHGWIDAPLRVGDKIARLIGADAGEVAVADSTSINLYKCLAAALQLAGNRTVILSEPGNFPNDLYMAQGLERLMGSRAQLRLVDAAHIIDSIDEDVAVVLLTHVHYKTARKHDLAAITERAHAQGALIIWDLSHSAGAVAVDLNGVGADFAIGCGYKYLNGGPGCPAFIFVARRHQGKVISPLTGWLGHARPFDFTDEYTPAAGIARFLCGAHPIPGIFALEVGVDLLLAADPTQVWEKSRRLTELFIQRVETTCRAFDIELASPRDCCSRGSHVSFRHPHGYAVIQDLIARNVVGDFRAPDIMRFGFTPLYLRYEDVWNAAETLHDVLRSESWRHADFHERRAVT